MPHSAQRLQLLWGAALQGRARLIAMRTAKRDRPGFPQLAVRASILASLGRRSSWCRLALPFISSVAVLLGIAASRTCWPEHLPGSRSADELLPVRIAAMGNRVSRIVPCRETPVQVIPSASMKHLVGDDEFSIALISVLPRWSPPTVSALIHELKCWGSDFVFSPETGAKGRSGAFVVRTLLNDEHCVANTVTGPVISCLTQPTVFR